MIFNNAGEVVNITATEKIRFNGERMTARAAVDSMIKDGFKSQLAEVTVKDNVLTELNLAKVGRDEDKFSLDCVLFDASFNENIRSYIFDSKTIDPRFEKEYNAAYGVEFSTGTQARALMVGNRDANGIIPKDDIMWVDSAVLTEGTKWDEVAFYDVDKANVSSVAVIEAKTVQSAVDFRGANFKWFVVSDVKEVYDSETGTTSIRVNGWQRNQEVSYTLDELYVEETDGTDPNATTAVNKYDLSEYSRFVCPGDILQVKVNVKNEIECLRRIFTHQAKDPLKFDKNTIYKGDGYKMADRQSGNYNTNSGSLHIYGRVVAKTHDSKILIRSNIDGVDVYRSRALVERNDVSFYRMSKTREGYVIETIKPADIIGDEVSGSEVVVQSRVTGLLDVVILDE